MSLASAMHNGNMVGIEGAKECIAVIKLTIVLHQGEISPSCKALINRLLVHTLTLVETCNASNECLGGIDLDKISKTGGSVSKCVDGLK